MSYFAPHQPEYNYLQHLQLMQWSARQPISPENLRYYTTHVNAEGESDDWLFDSFLSFYLHAPSGNALHADINIGTTSSGEGDFFAVPCPNPGNALDWEETLASVFAGEGFVPLLENSVKTAKKKLGAPPHKRNVVLTLPYPHHIQSAFGPVADGGPSLNFSILNQNLMQASEQRLEACKWYVDRALMYWERQNAEELELLGFYWVYESMRYSWDIDDHWVLKELYKYIREKGYRLFWIPFYSSFNVNMLTEGRGFYFDCAFLQPNHMFYQNIKGVEKAAREARERGAGMEMEYYMDIDPEVDLGKERIPRFYNYLNGGVKYGYMKESVCAYFNGFNDVHKMAQHPDAQEREVYHDLYHFIKGDYEIKEKG